MKSKGVIQPSKISLAMSKAFTKETDEEEKETEEPEALPPGQKNYMTPKGFQTLREELRRLLNEERPKVVEIVSWAAGNGDRSENGDYIYGKKRLREIDRRVRYLTKRIESAHVVDPQQQKNLKQVFFGATVSYKRNKEKVQTVTLVGVDEAELEEGKISWLSPLSRTIMKAFKGDILEMHAPSGTTTLEIIDIRYGIE